jgi:hypothetical protein
VQSSTLGEAVNSSQLPRGFVERLVSLHAVRGKNSEIYRVRKDTREVREAYIAYIQ